MPVVPDAPGPSDGPLAEHEIDAVFAPLRQCRKLALAVSGGADSSALLHFFQQWRSRQARVPDAIVFTVDHGLRPEAADEALAVARRCAFCGLEHRILRWEGDKPASGIQKAARDARFALMRDAMRACGADALVLAHHRDDQAETFLDRLARGSGAYGLAAMAPSSTRDGVTICRPLLDLPKARLVASLRAANLDWCEDPSNADPRYRRVAMRALLPVLEEAGLGAERLAATARSMKRAADALDSWVGAVMRAHVERHEAGPCRFDLTALEGLPEEIVLRLFARLVRDCSGAAYVPRLSALEGAVAALTDPSGEASVTRTLGDCLLLRRKGAVLICREAGRNPPRALDLAPGERGVWDRRFQVSLEEAASEGVRVAALGKAACVVRAWIRRTAGRARCSTARPRSSPAARLWRCRGSSCRRARRRMRSHGGGWCTRDALPQMTARLARRIVEFTEGLVNFNEGRGILPPLNKKKT
ncbi:tRNA lysidine(34) synthetase TilS [Breoghania sp. L-A4]|uniref:tRNA lysidine(34) synthetase TilS n=1 Tax=Breoghania sp. L-A4 TaxID=2304600 RepID=UPI0013C2A70C|nr:tRNA lysidine(34) synthetase TilS [Breoghania sp. L-A4]